MTKISIDDLEHVFVCENCKHLCYDDEESWISPNLCKLCNQTKERDGL